MGNITDILVSALPDWMGLAPAVLFILLGGYLLLSYEGMIPGPFRGRRKDDD